MPSIIAWEQIIPGLFLEVLMLEHSVPGSG
jgi:hypothetical protein